MMRQQDVEDIARARPFQPFEIRMVDGQRFRLTSVEQFLVGRNAMCVLTPRGTIAYLGIGLISTIRILKERNPRKRA